MKSPNRDSDTHDSIATQLASLDSTPIGHLAIDKNFNVVFVLDVSNSMLFTSGKKFKAEFGAEIVYAISQAAASAGEAIGLAMFSNGVVKSLRPSFGKGMRIRFEMLLSDKKNYGGVRDFKRSMMQLNSMITARSKRG